MEKKLNDKKPLAMLPLDEERDLIKRAQTGDSAAMVKIIEQYEPVVLAAARRRSFRTIYDDALATAYLALVAAVREYDSGRGVNFASWARAKVYGDLATLLKREIRRWNRETASDCLHAGD